MCYDRCIVICYFYETKETESGEDSPNKFSREAKQTFLHLNTISDANLGRNFNVMTSLTQDNLATSFAVVASSQTLGNS